MFKEISKDLVSYLEKLGINPLYFFTAAIIIIHVGFDYNNYKNWNKISNGQKFYVIVTLMLVLLLISFSILQLMGIFP